MSRIKNMPRMGWFIVGVAITVLLMPSVAVAAGLKFTGIEGTSDNKADVSPAGQLLTTAASPSAYEDYEANVAFPAPNARQACTTLTTISAGHAFVVEQVEVDVESAYTYAPSESPLASQATFTLHADSSACNEGSATITSGEAPQGTVGNVAIPVSPGYVVPSGYSIDVFYAGWSGNAFVTGYLIPSADASSTPTN
jgi:hypothetical protein